jgi:hypothetical protein
VRLQPAAAQPTAAAAACLSAVQRRQCAATPRHPLSLGFPSPKALYTPQYYHGEPQRLILVQELGSRVQHIAFSDEFACACICARAPSRTQAVSQSDNLYHFTLQLPPTPLPDSDPAVLTQQQQQQPSSSGGAITPWSAGPPAAAALGSRATKPCAWTLGCYTNDERREWIEAIFNARLPADEQARV